MDEEDTERKKVMLFGRDIATIPCFRDSFLYGISGGLGCAFVHFIASSNIPKATHFGLLSFMAITTAYWIPCRYNYSKVKFELAKAKAMLDMQIETEGTIHQKDFEKMVHIEKDDIKTV